MTTEEGNKLITVFMKAGYWQAWKKDGYKPHWATHYQSEQEVLDVIKNYYRSDKSLFEAKFISQPYNGSWESIMPVVEKVVSLDDYSAHILVGGGHSTTIITSFTEGSKAKASGNKLIQSVWKAVVEFIVWYNQNNPS